MTLSERIVAGEASAELDEAIAMAMGWAKAVADVNETQYEWWAREGSTLSRVGCPSYRTDIRLTLAEIERQCWDSSHITNQAEVTVEFTVWSKAPFSAKRTDRNLTLAAITALLKAMGE